jgi:stage II sporulation protein AA (anti-sigma F factor antagonist)
MADKTTTEDIAVIEPVGVIDTRASIAFEKQVVELLAAGKRLFAIDFSKVELITSAGIRVLVMLAQRLQGSGAMVLFALGEQVRTVFDVAGLMRQFRVAASRQEAVQQLSADPHARTPAAAPSSKVARLAMRLLAGDADVVPAGGAGRASPSPLAVEVATLLRKRQG